MSKKRRFLGKLIANLQNNIDGDTYEDTSLEPNLQKRRPIVVPLYSHIRTPYEFFLVGEINLELQLDAEEDYFPIGKHQSPLNKWRPFVKAEKFSNRIEMTIDASYPGISEFEFIINKLQCCSSDIYKQLAFYLQGYQHFVRRIKEKMLKNPVPQRLYEFKFQTFLKKSTEFVDALPKDEYYAVSILQLDYQIHNTKRIKFMVSKALAEVVGGVDLETAAQLLLRKGWVEVFGGAERIMKNIMLLNRLMKEGQQLLKFKIYTVDKIQIQVSAEIEIVQSLRSYVDVGFVEMLKFTIAPETLIYLNAVRAAARKNLITLPNEPFFAAKTVDLLPESLQITIRQLANQTKNVPPPLIPELFAAAANNSEGFAAKLEFSGLDHQTSFAAVAIATTNSENRFRHPNFYTHYTDTSYEEKCTPFLKKFYANRQEELEQIHQEQQEKGTLNQSPSPPQQLPVTSQTISSGKTECANIHQLNSGELVVGFGNSQEFQQCESRADLRSNDEIHEFVDEDLFNEHATDQFFQKDEHENEIKYIIKSRSFQISNNLHSIGVPANPPNEFTSDLKVEYPHGNHNDDKLAQMSQLQAPYLPPNLFQTRAEFTSAENLAELMKHEREIIQDLGTIDQKIEYEPVLVDNFDENDIGFNENDDNCPYFNIFDDDSLNFTAKDLNFRQRKLQKLVYYEFHDKFG